MPRKKAVKKVNKKKVEVDDVPVYEDKSTSCSCDCGHEKDVHNDRGCNKMGCLCLNCG